MYTLLNGNLHFLTKIYTLLNGNLHIIEYFEVKHTVSVLNTRTLPSTTLCDR